MKFNNLVFVRNADGALERKEFADAQLGLLRIADPVATSVVQGFTNADYVGDILFPSLRMEKETGRMPAFGKEVFVIPANIKRAIGEKVQRVNVQSGYVTMALSEYALGVAVENRERNEWAGDPDMLVNGKLTVVSEKIALYRENLQATLATNSSNYATANKQDGSGLGWAGDGNPIVDMRKGWKAIRASIGRRPNVAWFTPQAWELFINNRKVLERIVYGGAIIPATITEAMVASLLQVDKVIVAYAVNGTGTNTDGGVKKTGLTMGYVWEPSGNAFAGLAFVGKAAGIEPSFGYTYERKNSPVVESYYDNTTKSQVWDYEHFFDPSITLAEAGYLIYNVA